MSRKAVLLLLSCLPIWLFGQQGSWQWQTLSNGALAGYFQDSTRKEAHLGLSLRGGSSLDELQKDGLAAVYEQLFFQYLPDSTPAKESMLKGVLLSHNTQLEHHFFGISLPQSQLELGMQMFLMGLRTEEWDDQQLAKAQQRIAPTLQAQDDSPEFHLESEVLEEIWQKDASRKRLPGKYLDILKITSEQIRSQMAAYKHPGNVVITATGSAPAEQFFIVADYYMEDWRPNSAGALLPPLGIPNLSKDLYFTTINELATQPLIMMAWPIGPDSLGESQTARAELFCQLAQLKQSQMHAKLVKSGLAQSYNWTFAGESQPGQLLLYVLPTPERFQECLRSLQRMIPTLSSDSMTTAADLAAAKRQQQLHAAIRHDQSVSRLQQAGQFMLHDPDSLSKAHEPGIEDIQAFAATTFGKGHHAAGLLANTKTVFSLGADTLFRPLVEPKETLATANLGPTLLDPASLRSFRIYFQGNTFEPTDSCNAIIAEVADMLKAFPEKRIYINGYAEGQGDGVLNYKLSIQRSKSVREILSKEYGVPLEQLVIRAYGEAFPEFPDDTPEHRHMNRRVTFDYAPKDAVDNAY